MQLFVTVYCSGKVVFIWQYDLSYFQVGGDNKNTFILLQRSLKRLIANDFKKILAT